MQLRAAATPTQAAGVAAPRFVLASPSVHTPRRSRARGLVAVSLSLRRESRDMVNACMLINLSVRLFRRRFPPFSFPETLCRIFRKSTLFGEILSRIYPASRVSVSVCRVLNCDDSCRNRFAGENKGNERPARPRPLGRVKSYRRMKFRCLIVGGHLLVAGLQLGQ